MRLAGGRREDHWVRNGGRLFVVRRFEERRAAKMSEEVGRPVECTPHSSRSFRECPPSNHAERAGDKADGRRVRGNSGRCFRPSIPFVTSFLSRTIRLYSALFVVVCCPRVQRVQLRVRILENSRESARKKSFVQNNSTLLRPFPFIPNNKEAAR